MTRQRMVLSRVAINNGHDDADLVIEHDPLGEPVVHTVNKTQRQIDRLRRDRVIDADQYRAGVKLRDTWEKVGLGIGRPRARDWLQPIGQQHQPSCVVNNEAAWRRYCHALNRLSFAERRAALAVVIHDQDPRSWGQRWGFDGMAVLIRALDKLDAHWPSRRQHGKAA